jgi:hypothetical protein
MTEYYHGTRRGFRGRGGLIHPGEWFKGERGLYRAGRVYLTTNKDVAIRHAREARGPGMPKVVTVTVLEKVRTTVLVGQAPQLWVEAAFVKDVIWTDENDVMPCIRRRRRTA